MGNDFKETLFKYNKLKWDLTGRFANTFEEKNEYLLIFFFKDYMNKNYIQVSTEHRIVDVDYKRVNIGFSMIL